METKLTNVAVVEDADSKRKLRSGYGNINPDISNEDAKAAMVALAALSCGELEHVERTDKEIIFKAQEEEAEEF